MIRYIRFLSVVLLATLASADSIGVGSTFAITEKPRFMSFHLPIHRVLTPHLQLQASQFGQSSSVKQHDRIFFVKIPDFKTELPTFFSPTKRDTLQRMLNTFFGRHAGGCEQAYTPSCDHSFANPTYRPKTEQR